MTKTTNSRRYNEIMHSKVDYTFAKNTTVLQEKLKLGGSSTAAPEKIWEESCRAHLTPARDNNNFGDGDGDGDSDRRSN